jgi:hypothetical protein
LDQLTLYQLSLLGARGMGGDYYIVKQLRIEHSSGFKNIELQRKLGSYGRYPYDSDDVNHPDLESYYYEHYRKPFAPIILYDNGRWCSQKTRAKYGPMVSQAVGDHKLVKVIKTEYRYET